MKLFPTPLTLIATNIVCSAVATMFANTAHAAMGLDLSFVGSGGVSLEERIASDNGTSASDPPREERYRGFAQPSAKVMSNLSLQYLPWLGVTLGTGLSFEGFGSGLTGPHRDSSLGRPHSEAISHESISALAEAGLQQRFGGWMFQETFSTGISLADRYAGSHRLSNSRRQTDEDLDINQHTKAGVNLRLIRVCWNHLLVGAELSGGVGQVEFNEDSLGSSYDRYRRTTTSLILGLTL